VKNSIRSEIYRILKILKKFFIIKISKLKFKNLLFKTLLINLKNLINKVNNIYLQIYILYINYIIKINILDIILKIKFFKKFQGKFVGETV
jgi:hypothetical protein